MFPRPGGLVCSPLLSALLVGYPFPDSSGENVGIFYWTLLHWLGPYFLPPPVTHSHPNPTSAAKDMPFICLSTLSIQHISRHWMSHGIIHSILQMGKLRLGEDPASHPIFFLEENDLGPFPLIHSTPTSCSGTMSGPPESWVHCGDSKQNFLAL